MLEKPAKEEEIQQYLQWMGEIRMNISEADSLCVQYHAAGTPPRITAEGGSAELTCCQHTPSDPDIFQRLFGNFGDESGSFGLVLEHFTS